MPVSNVMPESASRLERKRTRNRDALVAAARGLFARDGFQAATIADIAEAADLGFGTFYRYFADKEAVLEAIFEDGREELDAALHAEEPAGTPAPLALARLSRRFVHLVRRDHDLLDLMWQVAMRKPVGRRPLNIMIGGPEQSLPMVMGAAIHRIVDAGMAEGDFAPGDAELLSRLIASAHMYLLTPMVHDTDEAAVAMTLCEFELRALGVTDTSAVLMSDPGIGTTRRRAVGGH